MFRTKTPGHFLYNEYGIMKETQEPDKAQFVRTDNFRLVYDWQVIECASGGSYI